MKDNQSIRIWRDYLEKLVEPYNQPDCIILDIGIEGDAVPGGHAYLFQNADYQTLDIKEEYMPTHVGDIRSLNMDDESFDCVLAISMLEHIINDRQRAFQEIYRVLKKGGLALMIAPCKENFSQEYAEATPVTIAEIRKALPEADLVVRYFRDSNDIIAVEVRK